MKHINDREHDRAGRVARRKRAVATIVAGSLVVAGLTLGATPALASPGQSVSDLNTVPPEALVAAIVGTGVTTSNIVYTGDARGAGLFSGFGAVGFPSGLILSSGEVSTVPGPNKAEGTTGSLGAAGDSDLDELVSSSTLDASVLTFDFVPTTSQLTFDYVFASDEYSEYSNSQYNDVFAFFVNGTNCARTPDGAAVSINTINGGNPLGTDPQRPELFRDNSIVIDDEGEQSSPIDVEPDGLTVVLHCAAAVNANQTNTMKLAIADTADSSLDSEVFLAAGSIQANHPPVAADKSVTTDQDTPVSVTLSATDPDGDTLTYTVGTAPAHGTLTGTGANLTYTPTAGYSGPDSFTYTANDGAANSNTATVSITVTPAVPVNHPPVAADKSVTTDQDTPVGVTLSATDPDGDTLTYTVGTAPAHGTLTGTGANLTYTPTAGYSGPDSFTYTANDGAANSNTATVSITVTPAVPVNHPPVAADKSVTTDQDTPVGVTLSATDPDGDTLTYTVGTAPAHGTLTGTGANLTYTPTAGYSGPDSFTYTANDGAANSNTATVSITVKEKAQPSTSPTVDVTVSTDQKKSASSVTSPKFSTSAGNRLLLAFVSYDGPAAPTQSVKSMAGGGLTWKLVKRSNSTWGTAEVWQAYAPAKLTDAKVTASMVKGGFHGSITVTAFADAAKSVGASAAGAGLKGAPKVTLTPTKPGSLVWATGHDWSTAAQPVADPGQVLVHTFIDKSVGDTFWVQKVQVPTAASPVTVSDSSPQKSRWQLVAVEIPPAS